MSLTNLLDVDASRLEVWLSAAVAGGADVTVQNAQLSTTSGMSNDTLFFDACWPDRRERFAAGWHRYPRASSGPTT